MGLVLSLVISFEMGGNIAVPFENIDDLKRIIHVAKIDHIVAVRRAPEVRQQLRSWAAKNSG
jgi:hypothetical protein